MRAIRLTESWIAALAAAAIALHLVLRFAGAGGRAQLVPLWAALAAGGAPLCAGLIVKLAKRELGADLLAGISIVVSVLLGEWLAGALVVLMLSGGGALERYAVGRASSVLRALAKRMPSVAHRRREGALEDVALDEIAVGETLVVLPHEVCPVDGEVIDGHGTMDESYLTGEPYSIAKAPGAAVLSGAVNGDGALAIRAVRRAVDSRYARITEVMRESAQRRPRLRRLGDRLGAAYLPIALALAAAAWLASGSATRFLAVLVVATPCPLLIAIPVAVIGSVSLAGKRSIVIKDPAVLEQIDECRTIILDKTGTLTHGKPLLTDRIAAPGADAREALRLAASVEQYSKHPLAGAVVEAARAAGLAVVPAVEVAERAGDGLRGTVDGRSVRVTGRKSLDARATARLPPSAPGLECVVLLDGEYAATFRFHDRPRSESGPFVRHLGPKHRIDRVLLVSGDRESEVRWLAEQVGIGEVRAGQSPEQKVAIARDETRRAKTLFIGDGINDAPALLAATVGVAFGRGSDVTAEAAGAVILEASLERVDDLFHIGRRLRRIALQSAIGGMALSVVGMALAAFGLLPPVAGAVAQEAIDLLAIANALRVALPARRLADFA